MTTARIFQCVQDRPDDRQLYARPIGDSESPQDKVNKSIVHGVAGADPAQWTPWEFVVTEWADTDEHVPVQDWDGSYDFFKYDGTCNIWSVRAIEMLRPCLGDRFLPLPMTINSRPYFMLAPLRKLDVVDAASVEAIKSRVRIPPSYSFAKDQIPDLCMFLVPGLGSSLFFTESAIELAKAEGLVGLRFVRVDE